MSLSMRRRDWERLFADYPNAGYDDNDFSQYWQYDPLSVALARSAALWRRDVGRPFERFLGRVFGEANHG